MKLLKWWVSPRSATSELRNFPEVSSADSTSGSASLAIPNSFSLTNRPRASTRRHGAPHGTSSAFSLQGTTVVMSSHYMDEVDALAHRVAVLSRGRIAAQGSTASLGGRDRGEATIRFTKPDNVAVSELPVTPSRVEGNVIELKTPKDLAVLHRLISWALEGNVAIEGLTVSRDTLEDIYLALTRSDREESEARAI